MNQAKNIFLKVVAMGARPFNLRSIRVRLLLLSLSTTIVAILVVTAVAINLARNVSDRAQDTSSQSLREQAEDYLVQINATIAGQNDLILDRAARDVQTVAEAASAIYERDLPGGYWPPDQHITEGPEGQFLNGPEDISSVFVPNTTALNKETLLDIELGGYLDLSLEPVFNNNPNAAAIYFGTVNDVTRYYPNIELGTLVPADFQVTQRPWYTASLTGNEGRPQPTPIWSPVYLDATGLGLVTTVAMPVFDQAGALRGVIGLDLTLDEISANIETARFLESGYSFLVDRDGLAVILPEQGYQDVFGRSPEPDEFAPDMREAQTKFAGIVEHMVLNQSGFESLEIGEREIFVAYSPLQSAGWSLGSVVIADEVLESIPLLQQEVRQATRSLVLTRVIPIVALLSITLVFLVMVLINKIVNPIQELASAATEIGAEKWDVPIPVVADDEIGLLARTLSDMRDKLRASFSELEERVAQRTTDLERRAIQLQTSAEVMRTIASVHELEMLLTHVTQLISQRFGFYHVGVFLADEEGEFVILQAANSAGGARMLEREHKLRIGEVGIVGTVAGTRQPRIAMDVNLDEAFYKNPDLPETRSEMALPLVSGGELLGVLDVQSKAEAAFIQEDIAVLQILADQIAVAIENARLFAERQKSLEAIKQAYGQLSQEAWGKMLRTQPEFGYQSKASGFEGKPSGSWDEIMNNARQSGKRVIEDGTVAIPIKIRDQVTGAIKFKKGNGSSSWRQEEIETLETLCEQVSVALESARLYDETRRRAERERLTGEITAKLRASDDPQTILQTTISELRKALHASRTQVLIQKQDAITEKPPEFNGEPDKREP